MSRVCERIAGISLATKYSSLPRPDHDRRAGTRRDDLARVFRGENRQRVDAAQVGAQLCARRLPAGRHPIVFFDQVRDDFGVRLGDEFVAFALQFVLQLEVIFDDAVVHDDDLAFAIAMRVGVLFGGTSVRGPARVARGRRRRRSARGDGLFELASLPGARRSSSLPLSSTTAMPAES